MKPAAFAYHRPGSIAEAVAILAAHAGEARVLAGGQSLVPTMAFRLATPAHIVDINRLPDADRIEIAGGAAKIGALVRHAAFAPPGAAALPEPLRGALATVARHIAHLPIRERGTFCGSIAHSDPASEWCLVGVTLGGTVHAVSRRGERLIAMAAFLRGALVNALEDDELVTHVSLPLPAGDTRFAFQEFSRRRGDYALGMTLAALRVAEGRIVEARLGIGGIEPAARRHAEAERVLFGAAPGPDLFRRAADAVADSIDPMNDPQAPAAYRRDLIHALVRRALAEAAR